MVVYADANRETLQVSWPVPYLVLIFGQSCAIIYPEVRFVSSGIYRITNTVNGHFYIGQSRNIKRRWYLHKNNATKTKKHYTVLEKAFKKYGIEAFAFEIIEFCSVDDLDSREMFYISKMHPQYNMNSGGAGNNDYVCREETKKLLSTYGKRQWDNYDEETKKKIVQSQLTGPRKGSHRSQETKALLAERSKAYFQKMGGMPESQKKKISDSLKGKPRPNYGHYKPVIAFKEGTEVGRFGSIKEATATLCVSGSGIVHCLKGDQKTAGGYSWEYCSQETIRKE